MCAGNLAFHRDLFVILTVKHTYMKKLIHVTKKDKNIIYWLALTVLTVPFLPSYSGFSLMNHIIHNT